MTEAIIVAILSLIGTFSASYLAHKKSVVLIAYRLEQLEDKVNKHNLLVERTYALEQKDEVRKEQIKVINHRIKDLEKKGES